MPPAENSQGEVKTWVNSQWKFGQLPDQFLVELDSYSMIRSCGIGKRAGGPTLPPLQQRRPQQHRANRNRRLAQQGRNAVRLMVGRLHMQRLHIRHILPSARS